MHPDHVCKWHFKDGFSDFSVRQKGEGQGRKGTRERVALPAPSPITGSFQSPLCPLGEELRVGAALDIRLLEEVGPLTRSWWWDAEAGGRCWQEGDPDG